MQRPGDWNTATERSSVPPTIQGESMIMAGGASVQQARAALDESGHEALAATIPRIVEYVERHWSQPFLPEFTDHGPRHSENVADFALRLLDSSDIPERYRLHAVEKYILWAASWLHDIGMQDLGEELVGDLTPASHARIRSEHARRSADAIREHWAEIGLVDDAMLTEAIALVAGAHGTSSYRETCDHLYQVKSVWNREVRGALLAACLLISDEMDLDSTRVPSLPAGARRTPVSAAHALKHKLVVSAGLEHGGGGRIQLNVCFQTAKGIDAAEQQMMERWVLEKLREQIALVENDFAQGVNLYAQISREIRVTHQPGGHLQGLTPAGRHIVEADLARYDLINHEDAVRRIDTAVEQFGSVVITGRLRGSLSATGDIAGYVDVDGREDLLRSALARRRVAGATVLASSCLYETLGASSLADVLTDLLLSIGVTPAAADDRDVEDLRAALEGAIETHDGEIVIAISSFDLLPVSARDWIRGNLLDPVQATRGVAYLCTADSAPPDDIAGFEVVPAYGLEREGVVRFLARYVEPGVAESEAAGRFQYAKYQELRQNHLLPPIGGVTVR